MTFFVEVKERRKHYPKTFFNLCYRIFRSYSWPFLTLVSNFFDKFCEFFLIKILVSADSNKIYNISAK